MSKCSKTKTCVWYEAWSKGESNQQVVWLVTTYDNNDVMPTPNYYQGRKKPGNKKKMVSNEVE